jgi:phosphatidylserine decarboxylase
MRYIHRAGRHSILLSLGISAIVLYISFTLLYFDYPIFFYILAGGSLLINLWVISFFRNPKRIPNLNEDHILAPADGVVVALEETHENEYLNEVRMQVSIFMSPINVHFNKMPVGGKVKYKKHHRGKYLVAWHPKSSELNERTTMVIENPNFTLLIRQIAGIMARRIINYVKVGDVVQQGDDLGFIKFGSRVDMFIPLNATINVSLHDVTTANKTVIAKFD